jgi:hypothetical protein
LRKIAPTSSNCSTKGSRNVVERFLRQRGGKEGLCDLRASQAQSERATAPDVQGHGYRSPENLRLRSVKLARLTRHSVGGIP